MLVPISAIYTALLALVGLGLQQLVGRERLRSGVSINDGGDADLAVAMRRQANFVEQVPIALLLLVVLELNGASGAWLHALGLSLLVCRVVHPLGLRFDDSKVPARFLGAFGTLLVVLVEIGLAGWQARLG